MPRDEKQPKPRTQRTLRTRDDIVRANEDIFNGALDGTYPPKQIEQCNTVVKAQMKILFEIPLKLIQLWRDLRKSGVDVTDKDSAGMKLLQANPALNDLLGKD